MTSELEQLAALIDSHGLTRLEYEKGDLRVVMERQVEPGGQVLPSVPSDQLEALSFYLEALNHPDASRSCPKAPNHSSEEGELAAMGSNPADSSASAAPDVVTIVAPLVGIVYRSREPGATPLVEHGQRVAEGDVVCLIEAMKLFNEITAPVSGVIDAVLFEDGDLAEYGAPLITILPGTD